MPLFLRDLVLFFLFLGFFSTANAQYFDKNYSDNEGQGLCLIEPQFCGLSEKNDPPSHENQFFVFIIFAGLGVSITILVLLKHKQN